VDDEERKPVDEPFAELNRMTRQRER